MNSLTSPLVGCFLILLFFSCGKEEQVSLSWKELASPTEVRLNAVTFTDDGVGHAVGGDVWNSGLHLLTLDNGVTWEIDTISTKMLNGLYFPSSDSKGYAVGIGGIYQKTDLVTPWYIRGLDVLESLPPFNEVSFQNDGIGVIVGGISFNRGVILQVNRNFDVLAIHQFNNEVSAICFSDEMTAHAVGFGMVLNSKDAGATWNRLDIDSDFYRSVHFPTTTIGYAVGSSGTIIKTTDNGATWIKLRDGDKFSVSDEPFRSVYFWNENKGYIVGENGLFWQTLDGGSNWKQVKDFPNIDLFDIHVTEDKGYIVGNDGRIFEFEN